MSHTYAQNVVHVVFSTKARYKSIDGEFRPKLWAYTKGICRKLDIYVHAVGGMDDHLHLLIQIPPALTLSKAVATIESNSSRWATEEGPQVRMAGRLWSIQRERVGDSRRHSLHTESGKTSQEDGFRYGVCSVVEKTWNRV